MIKMIKIRKIIKKRIKSKIIKKLKKIIILQSQNINKFIQGIAWMILNVKMMVIAFITKIRRNINVIALKVGLEFNVQNQKKILKKV